MLPQLGHVSFSLGEVVYESGGQMGYIYFPTTAIISLLYMMENGSSAEMGMAGNEGLVGVALFMGGNTMPNRAVVQSATPHPTMKITLPPRQKRRNNIEPYQAVIASPIETAARERL